MGAARDFERDENLDFSDLSDSNQSALERAKSRWGNAEVIRGNDGYNPSALASAENSSTSTASNSGISDSETISKDQKPVQSGGWQNNVSGGGTHKSRNAANLAGGGWKNLAKSFLGNKGAMATTGGLLSGVGIFIFVISTGIISLIQVHMEEIITEKRNSSAISMNNRSVKVMKLKIKGTNCKPAGLVCRMSKVTDRNIKNLEKAGFKVDLEEGESLFGRKKISKLTYIKDGKNIEINNSSKDIKNILTKNPDVRQAFRRGFSGRFASFLDKSWQKLKGWFNFTKVKKDNKGKTEEEIDEDIKKTANNHSKDGETDSKKLPGDKDDVDDKGNNKAQKGDEGTRKVKEKLKTYKDKLKKGAQSVSEKAAMGLEILEGASSTLNSLNAVDKVCGVYALVSMGWSVAKIAKVEVLAQFGLSFLSMASKIKAGEATQQEVTAQGNNLMGIANKKDSKENKNPDSKNSNTSRLKNAFAFFADSTSNNDRIKSATESQGWRAVAYDDRVSKLDDSAKDYQVGITGWFASLMNTLTTGMVGWFIRQSCKVAGIVTAVVGIAQVALTILKCMGTGFWGCIGDVVKVAIWAVALGLALSVAAEILKNQAMGAISKYVSEGLTGTILNDSTTGENFGNAIMSGSAAMMAKNSMAGSGGVLTKSQAIAFRQETDRQIAENAEDIRKTHSPFDPTTRHTFLGSIVSNMMPYAGTLGSIKGLLPSMIGGAQRSFASITPGASAANSANFAANMETCEDKSITDTGAATDIFCNVYTGIDMGIAETDTEEVVNKLKEWGDIVEKENSSETNNLLDTFSMSGDLKKYDKYCFNRKSPIGTSEDDDDETRGGICNTEKNPKANWYSLFLTDLRTEMGMNEEFKPDSSGGSRGNNSSSNSKGGVDPELSKLSGEFIWPLKNTKVKNGKIQGVSDDQGFNTPVRQNHPAIDFANEEKGWTHGAQVYAVADGEVVNGGFDVAPYNGCKYGTADMMGGPHAVIIKHKGDVYSFYWHMDSHSVKTGEKVKKGQAIGTIGNYGCSYGSHLHFELSKDSAIPSTSASFYPPDLIKQDT